ncbi:MAG TPA: MBL fold metallo-hydrolase [Lachnospiraceae bacterium]|nr:MBL fold metallo-hydrolase [Lachnospiraceae bacterium]
MQGIIRIDLGGVNCYLIKNKQRFILVDTGGHLFLDKQYSDRRNDLVNELEKNGVNDSNLEMIILTHGDNDHTCNARYIREKFNSKICMCSNDAFMVEKADSSCYRVNSNYQSLLFNLVFKLMNSKIKLLMDKVYMEFETFQPDILLKDEQSLSEYGFDGTIYHSPGHTKGSICILDNEGNLIAGDLFTNNKKPSLALNAQNFNELKESARKILRNYVVKIYPGHGESFDASSIRKFANEPG